MSNSIVDHSEKSSRPLGLRLAVAFMGSSAAVGLFVAIPHFWKPFPIIGHLMSEPDLTTSNGLFKYALSLVLILLFNVPLLYGGLAAAFNFSNVATSISLSFISGLFGITAWGLYRFKNWARLLTLAIAVFTFLPMLGDFPPFFVDSFAAMTAFLPFIAPYGLLVFYLRREDVRQLFIGCVIA